ncbi:MAG: ParB/RepB/Spo0J family partition protein [Deltaproteobacteria bacterium]|nr:ParB/RepB/Spo0J family partition protein [Deltaproteobacteria bacterium]
MNDKDKGRRVLGRGLGALIPGAGGGGVRPGGTGRDYFVCPVERISPNAGQPRKRMSDAGLSEMVDSIREQGIIQPLVVRRSGDGFEIIAGERRWRAAQLAGLKEVPVVIKEATSAEAFELAIVENIQREDLNPVELAQAFERLIEERGYTQAELATRVGRDRSTVANSLRLLGLPAEILGMVADGRLTEGHARAILQAGNAQNMLAIARKAAVGGLSVREIERRARRASSVKPHAREERPAASPQVRSLVERLQRALGARVKLVDAKGKGRIEITYTSYDELDRILNKILK